MSWTQWHVLIRNILLQECVIKFFPHAFTNNSQPWNQDASLIVNALYRRPICYLASPMLVNVWSVIYSVTEVSVTWRPWVCCNCFLQRTLLFDGSPLVRSRSLESRQPHWIAPSEVDQEIPTGREPLADHEMYQCQDKSTGLPSQGVISVSLIWDSPWGRSFRYWKLTERWRLVSVFVQQLRGTRGGMEAVERRGS